MTGRLADAATGGKQRGARAEWGTEGGATGAGRSPGGCSAAGGSSCKVCHLAGRKGKGVRFEAQSSFPLTPPLPHDWGDRGRGSQRWLEASHWLEAVSTLCQGACSLDARQGPHRTRHGQGSSSSPNSNHHALGAELVPGQFARGGLHGRAMTSQLKEVETGPRGAGTLGGWPGAAFLLSQVLRADADGNGEGVYATGFGDTRKQEQKRGSRKAPSHHCAHTHTNGGPRARPQAPPISGTTPRMPFSPESSWPGHGVARAQAAQRSRALTQGPACPGASPWSTRMTCVALREGLTSLCPLLHGQVRAAAAPTSQLVWIDIRTVLPRPLAQQGLRKHCSARVLGSVSVLNQKGLERARVPKLGVVEVLLHPSLAVP